MTAPLDKSFTRKEPTSLQIRLHSVHRFTWFALQDLHLLDFADLLDVTESISEPPRVRNICQVHGKDGKCHSDARSSGPTLHRVGI